MVVMYWRVEESFVTGRTRALGLKDVLASEGVMKKKKANEQKRKRQWNDEEAIVIL